VNIHITSDAFLEGEVIPTKYTCDGDELSPDLRWGDIPPNTLNFNFEAERIEKMLFLQW